MRLRSVRVRPAQEMVQCGAHNSPASTTPSVRGAAESHGGGRRAPGALRPCPSHILCARVVRVCHSLLARHQRAAKPAELSFVRSGKAGTNIPLESVSLHPKQPALLKENGKLLRGHGDLCCSTRWRVTRSTMALPELKIIRCSSISKIGISSFETRIDEILHSLAQNDHVARRDLDSI